MIHLVPPYFDDFGKRLTKSPKLVFLDQGLASFLMGLHTRESILQGIAAGALAESAVAAEWIKAFRQSGQEPRVFHWRAHGGLEIDLLIEHEGRLHGLDTKSTATPTLRHAEHLQRWLDLVGRRARGAIACQVERPLQLTATVRAVPWHLAIG